MYLGLNGKTKNDGKLPCKIDEVRIWNTVRTAQEIEANYKKQLIGNEAGLLSYYQFNKSVYTDKTTTGNTLVPTGTVSFESTGFGTYLNDIALNFDGTNDIASIPALVTGNASFTYEAQFRTTSTTGYGRVFANTNYGFDVAILNGGVRVYTGTWRTIASSGLNDGKWHHLAIVKDAGTIIVYVDGTQAGQLSNVTLNIASSFALGGPIGGGNTSTSDFFNGDLDEVRIWNTVRTAQEIATNRGKELVGNEAGLLGYYDMNTPATPVYDVTANAKDLTRAGATGTNNTPQFVVGSGKENILTSVYDVSESVIQISVYPNPIHEWLSISSELVIDKVQVLDINGALSLEQSSDQKAVQLSTEHLKAGVYVVKVLSGSSSKSLKIVKR